jgi:ribosomal protein S18 acetylase RimI-like enzyme
MLSECSDRERLSAALREFGVAARFPLALLDRPGPAACRFWADEGAAAVVAQLGGNVIPLFRRGCGRAVAEWLRAQSGLLTQMIVPEPLGNELLGISRLPSHRTSVTEMLAEMRELRAEAPADLRVAGTEDSVRLAQLYRPQTFAVAEFLPFPERFRYALAAGRFCYIERDGRPVAACHTLPEAAGIGQVMGVVTDPSYRGRGLGRAVVTGLCRMLLDGGLVPQLFYETRNNATRGLYRSLGFEDRIAYLTIDFL